ncbi:MAG: DJ-1/PfpI family protein [Nannocystaceae bacterium]
MTKIARPIRSIGFVLFPGVNALDVVGPHEVLARLRDVEVRLLGSSRGPVRTDTDALVLHATHEWTDSNVDVLVIPGGRGVDAIAQDAEWMQALAAAVEGASEVLTVCTGAVLLARTGRVSGRRAATHWAHHGELKALGVEVSETRTCRDGAWWSGAGVSAGIDLALRFVGEAVSPRLAHRITVAMEYDPQPPFGVGRLETLSQEEQAAMRAALSPPDVVS